DAFEATLAELDGSTAIPEADHRHLAALARDVERVRGREAARPRLAVELLAELRAGSGTASRRAAFETLVESPILRWAGIRAAVANSDPRIRIAALRSLTVDDAVVSEVAAALCADTSPRVRAVAANTIARLGLAPDVLLERLAVELDPYTYRCVHEALRRLVGPFVELASDRDLDPDLRRDNLDAWRRHWNR
ncbi:MAG: hypothetical protein KDB80_01255, partial [Planctomycetes bacterium]|nr:hypothetical protein [Planctomycetota bacterium]